MKQLNEWLEVTDEILGSIKELIIAKNHDYAADDDVFRNINTMAELVRLLRLDLTKPTHLALFGVLEKVHRLVNLESKSEDAMNEPARDSIRDGIVFLLMYSGLRRKNE